MSSDLSESQLNHLNLIIKDISYDAMSREQRIKLVYKTDNFLEAVYVAPQMFDLNTFKILKFRENKLSMWRHNSQVIGGLLYLSVYFYHKFFRSHRGFYFRNFMFTAFGTALFSYISGRLGEFIGNKFYYEKILFKLASTYNITDDEIEELQYKVNEEILKENKEEQIKRSSLDNVKFRL